METKGKKVRTANNILLFHLGTIDILLGVLFLIFSIPGIKGTEWSTAGAPCEFHGFLFTLLHPLALWTICGLNCDRFYVIAAPLHYSHIVSPKKVLVGLGAGWAISLLLCIPPLFAIAPYRYIPGLGGCGPDFSAGSGTLWYSTLYTAFTLLLPATVIICCNLKIFMIARYHRHRIASAIYEVTLSAQVTITHQRNPFFVPTVTAPSSGGPKFRGRSAIYTVFQLVGSFLVLYVPYYIMILWEATMGALHNNSANRKISDGKLHSNFYTLASCLLISTLPVNGFLYGIKSKALRKTFQNYWRKKQTKSEVNQEIQARTPSTCGSRRPSLTPLGFFTRPSIQRRLSETLIDVNKAIRSPSKNNKIKRIASDITWRPPSTNSLNHSPKEEYDRQIKQTTSCNTLQVPSNEQDVSMVTEEEIYQKLKHKTMLVKPSSTNLLLQKFFGVDHDKNIRRTEKLYENTPERSPRILITRAFSEESDKSSHPTTPNREIAKTYSTSASTLIERKWRYLSFKEEDSDSEDKKGSFITTKPLLENFSLANHSSDSSETSESFGGRLYMSLDHRNSADVESEAGEEQLLLSWNTHKKYGKSENLRKTRPTLVRQTLVNVQSQEIVL
ncbi:hypothetical protein JTB14_018496 [Gonioctena quinquepunctata]|nr:hypothetical protein JTB14_018496 [Gonioctena quinquepunctata]